MNTGLFARDLLIPQPTRHRIFVSFHHGGDQNYYDAFSRTFHDRHELIYDNSVERAVDSDNVDYVMRRIREDFITGTSCTIVLVGKETAYRKFVDWEIDSTLSKKHALIGVQLPTAALTSEHRVIVPDRLFDNIQSGFASWTNWGHITSSPSQLGTIIDEAKARDAGLIVNSRERRLRNGQ